METLMKILAATVALAIALSWTASGEAQSKKSKARSAATTQQHVPRRVKVAARNSRSRCAARTWAGCQGWDPDRNVRSMIQMDAGRDDQP